MQMLLTCTDLELYHYSSRLQSCIKKKRKNFGASPWKSVNTVLTDTPPNSLTLDALHSGALHCCVFLYTPERAML